MLVKVLIEYMYKMSNRNGNTMKPDNKEDMVRLVLDRSSGFYNKNMLPRQTYMNTQGLRDGGEVSFVCVLVGYKVVC